MDYTATGLTLRQHPLALLRPALTKLGYHDTRHLNTARPGSSIRLPGIVLMRQRPGTAKGIVFVTLEDEFGIANLVIYTDVGERDRSALIGARLCWPRAASSVRRTTRKCRSRTSSVESSSTAAISWGPSPSRRGRVTLISQRRVDPGKQRQPLGCPRAETFDDRQAAAAHFRTHLGRMRGLPTNLERVPPTRAAPDINRVGGHSPSRRALPPDSRRPHDARLVVGHALRFLL